MAEVSRIEWTDATFNPWLGCEKVGPGCDHCYAESLAKRMHNGRELWQGVRRQTSEAYWRGPRKWAQRLPERLGRRPRVFCASMADVFDKVVPSTWRFDLFRLIAATPELDWLLLTKRVPNIKRMLPTDWGDGYPNVWLGATVVTQDEVDRDVDDLLEVPAAVHWLSIEPMLEPIVDVAGVDWVVVGGESGPKARPLEPAWALAVRDECARAGAAFFFKQGSAANWPRFKDFKSYPLELQIREFPA